MSKRVGHPIDRFLEKATALIEAQAATIHALETRLDMAESNIEALHRALKFHKFAIEKLAGSGKKGGAKPPPKQETH